MKDDGLTDTIVHELRQLLAKQLPFCELVALLEVGSTAEGLATATSDVDVMAVLRGDLAQLAWQYICVMWEARELQVQLVPMADLEQTAAQSGANISVRTSIRELELQYRLLFGKPWLAAPCVEAAMRAFLPGTFVRNAIVRYQEGAMDIVEDLHGCMQSGRRWTAAELGRELARTTVDAYLLSRGDGYPKAKWRIEKILRTAPAGAGSRFLALEFGFERADDATPPDATLKDALEVAMLAARATFFVRGDVARLVDSSPSWLGRYRAAPGVVLLRPRGGWLALSPSRSYELDDAAALCLSALAGKVLFEGRGVPRELQFQPKVEVGRAQAAQIFRRLEREALIEQMKA